jgi:hypothetical protein
VNLRLNRGFALFLFARHPPGSSLRARGRRASTAGLASAEKLTRDIEGLRRPKSL